MVLPLADTSELGLRAGAKRCVRLYAEDALDLAPGDALRLERHQRLPVPTAGSARFALDIGASGDYAIYSQHLAEDFALTLCDGQDRPLAPECAHAWVAQYDHDDQVSSVGIDADTAWVEHLAWSPGGDRLASASGRHVRIWTPAGELIARTPAHASAVSGLHWCSEAEIASACYGGLSFYRGSTGRAR